MIRRNLDSEKVLGIAFFNGTAAEAVEVAVREGGCVLLPAAPALLKLSFDEQYRRSLQAASMVLLDSGFLRAIWKLRSGRALEAISGIDYLRALLAHPQFRDAADSIWVVRSETAKVMAIEFVHRCGLRVTEANFQIFNSPTKQGAFHQLLLAIEERNPKHIVLALSRDQEELGTYLQEYLLQRPAIHCVGAAVGFLSGEEPRIPEWTRRSGLGWLARIVSQPRMALPRLGIAVALAALIFRYGSELPPLRSRWTDL